MSSTPSSAYAAAAEAHVSFSRLFGETGRDVALDDHLRTISVLCEELEDQLSTMAAEVVSSNTQGKVTRLSGSTFEFAPDRNRVRPTESRFQRWSENITPKEFPFAVDDYTNVIPSDIPDMVDTYVYEAEDPFPASLWGPNNRFGMPAVDPEISTKKFMAEARLNTVNAVMKLPQLFTMMRLATIIMYGDDTEFVNDTNIRYIIWFFKQWSDPFIESAKGDLVFNVDRDDPLDKMQWTNAPAFIFLMINAYYLSHLKVVRDNAIARQCVAEAVDFLGQDPHRRSKALKGKLTIKLAFAAGYVGDAERAEWERSTIEDEMQSVSFHYDAVNDMAYWERNRAAFEADHDDLVAHGMPTIARFFMECATSEPTEWRRTVWACIQDLPFLTGFTRSNTKRAHLAQVAHPKKENGDLLVPTADFLEDHARTVSRISLKVAESNAYIRPELLHNLVLRSGTPNSAGRLPGDPFQTRFTIKPSALQRGLYRSIMDRGETSFVLKSRSKAVALIGGIDPLLRQAWEAPVSGIGITPELPTEAAARDVGGGKARRWVGAVAIPWYLLGLVPFSGLYEYMMSRRVVKFYDSRDPMDEHPIDDIAHPSNYVIGLQTGYPWMDLASIYWGTGQKDTILVLNDFSAFDSHQRGGIREAARRGYLEGIVQGGKSSLTYDYGGYDATLLQLVNARWQPKSTRTWWTTEGTTYQYDALASGEYPTLPFNNMTCGTVIADATSRMTHNGEPLTLIYRKIQGDDSIMAFTCPDLNHSQIPYHYLVDASTRGGQEIHPVKTCARSDYGEFTQSMAVRGFACPRSMRTTLLTKERTNQNVNPAEFVLTESSFASTLISRGQDTPWVKALVLVLGSMRGSVLTKKKNGDRVFLFLPPLLPMASGYLPHCPFRLKHMVNYMRSLSPSLDARMTFAEKITKLVRVDDQAQEIATSAAKGELDMVVTREGVSTTIPEFVTRIQATLDQGRLNAARQANMELKRSGIFLKTLAFEKYPERMAARMLQSPASKVEIAKIVKSRAYEKIRVLARDVHLASRTSMDYQYFYTETTEVAARFKKSVSSTADSCMSNCLRAFGPGLTRRANIFTDDIARAIGSDKRGPGDLRSQPDLIVATVLPHIRDARKSNLILRAMGFSTTAISRLLRALTSGATLASFSYGRSYATDDSSVLVSNNVVSEYSAGAPGVTAGIYSSGIPAIISVSRNLARDLAMFMAATTGRILRPEVLTYGDLGSVAAGLTRGTHNWVQDDETRERLVAMHEKFIKKRSHKHFASEAPRINYNSHYRGVRTAEGRLVHHV